MKRKFFVIVLLLIVSMYPTQYLSFSHADNSKPPIPVFISVVPDGDNADYIFNQNDTVKIQFTADRFEVHGLILVGNGSGLSMNFTLADVRNFTKTSSLGPTTVYDIELNVTEYTQFVVYSWYTDITNRTMEEFDNTDGTEYHQLWIKEGSQYPRLDDIVGGTALDDEKEEFYTPLYSNVTIVYTAHDPELVNSTYVTLSFADSKEDLYNESKSNRINMTQTTFAQADNSTFEYTMNVTQRLIYFTAFNDYGWERQRHDQFIYHQITTGFDFNISTFFESEDEFTDLDPIVFNVTSVNSTAEDMLSYRYRYFENNTSEDPIVDWTEVSLDGFFLEQKYLNRSIAGVNHTQNVTIYNVYLPLNLNVSNILEVQAFVVHLGDMENDTLHRITIHDSKPEVSITTPDMTITNSATGYIAWDYSTLRGTVSEAIISSDTTSLSQSILGQDNDTVNFFEIVDTIIDANHTITINVTNSFEIVNISDPTGPRITIFTFRNVSAVYRVDTEAPTAIFVTEPSMTDANGKITVEFNFEDLGINPTGVVYAILSWGNGLVINVTSLEEATIIYRISGSYTITLNVTDAAGNINSISFSIDATVPTTETSKKKNSPISLISLFAGFVTLAIISKIITKRKNI